MQPQPLLSLVIPFYNAQQYLLPLLESIEQQLSSQVQLVLVADGPTDQSVALVQGFIAQSRLGQCYLLLQQANAGVSVARNLGISRAAGQYIGFVDADDVLLPGYITQVLQVITTHQPDLIELGYKRFSQPQALATEKARFFHKHPGHMTASLALTQAARVNQWFPWLRIYRRQAVADFQFPAGIGFCEDMMAIPALYLRSQRVYHVRQPLYGYRVHQASASYQVSPLQQQQLQLFLLQLRQRNCYPQLPARERQLMLLHLAYWLYNWQQRQAVPDEQHHELGVLYRQLIADSWWRPGFSWRKKWQLWCAASTLKNTYTRRP